MPTLRAFSATILMFSALVSQPGRAIGEYQWRGRAESVEITERGKFTVKRTGRLVKPKEGIDEVQVVDSTSIPELTVPGNSLTVGIGGSFGVRFRVRGGPDHELVNLKVRVLHPLLKNVKTGAEVTQDEWNAPTDFDTPRYSGWHCKTVDHCRSGAWTFQILYKDKVMAEESFEIDFENRMVEDG